jgi:hypothetical protein
LSTPTPAPAPAAAAAPPEAMLRGRFALFQLPDGGLLLVYRPDDSDDDRRVVIPSFVIAMATQASGGTPDELLARLRDGAV